MLVLQDISFAYPGHDALFTGLRCSLDPNDQVALIGNNGAGKTTLLRIMAGAMPPTSGRVQRDTAPYHIPQNVDASAHRTVAEALGVAAPLAALKRILNGAMRDDDLGVLNDDWTLEERCRSALATWGLEHVALDAPMRQLSGGERTKVMLGGIAVHAPELLLLDEPTNHLDRAGRERLYAMVNAYSGTLVVVSHDRDLLDLPNATLELSARGLIRYGGNYTFYQAQQAVTMDALQADVDHVAKALRKARQVERASMERQQKLDARGKRKQEKSGLPTIAMNTLRNQAEQSTARTKCAHAAKVADLRTTLQERLSELPDTAHMKLAFGTSSLHNGKVLVEAQGVNVEVNNTPLWPHGLAFSILSGERIALHGANGSGKTTLLRLIIGERTPDAGAMHVATMNLLYIDQHQSLLHERSAIYEQVQRFNTGNLPDYKMRTRLDRFGFSQESWDKPVHGLSGGERSRLLLCCLTVRAEHPDLLILDEPTNNLDIVSMEILAAAVKSYRGTLVVVSHDARFLKEVGIDREIVLE